MVVTTQRFLPHLIESIEDDLSLLRFEEAAAAVQILNSSHDTDQSISKGDEVMNLEAYDERLLSSKLHTPRRTNCNAVTAERLRQAIIASNYDLKRIQCSVNDFTLSLFGCVNRYFDLQMATRIARQFAEGRRIDLQVEVQLKPCNFEQRPSAPM